MFDARTAICRPRFQVFFVCVSSLRNVSIDSTCRHLIGRDPEPRIAAGDLISALAGRAPRARARLSPALHSERPRPRASVKPKRRCTRPPCRPRCRPPARCPTPVRALDGRDARPRDPRPPLAKRKIPSRRPGDPIVSTERTIAAPLGVATRSSARTRSRRRSLDSRGRAARAVRASDATSVAPRPRVSPPPRRARLASSLSSSPLTPPSRDRALVLPLSPPLAAGGR